MTSRRRACGRVHIDGYEAKIMAIGHLISSHHPKFRIRASTLGKPLTIRLRLPHPRAETGKPSTVSEQPSPGRRDLFLEGTRPPGNAGTSPSLQKAKKRIGLVQSPTKLNSVPSLERKGDIRHPHMVLRPAQSRRRRQRCGRTHRLYLSVIRSPTRCMCESGGTAARGRADDGSWV